jgi:hypothetical protein
MSVRKVILFLNLMVIFAACQAQEQGIAEVPTLAVLPSLTPSHTPTVTPSASPTETSTATPTATATSTHTPTLTHTPTITATPTHTPTATSSPTASDTPTNTVTNTPVPTNTPLASPTLPPPQIVSFVASATSVSANTSVTFTWSTVADAARIDQLNSLGIVTQSFNVIPTGTLPITVPGNLGKLVIYRLVAIRNAQEVTFSIPITVSCSIAWFFGNQYAPQNAGCPTGVQSTGPGAFQQFERGFMIYVNASSANRIFGAQNDGARYIDYLNGWDGSTTYTCFGTPPGGFFAPQNMFAWAYCNTNAPIGIWSSAVGWALGNIDTGNRTIQYEDTGAFYIDSPIGVFRFTGAGTSQWAKIN